MAVSPKKPYSSTSNNKGYGQKTTGKSISATPESTKKKPATSRKTVKKKPPPAGKSLSREALGKPAGKSLKAPGKTILPMKSVYNKKQRRFSLIDSDSSLSEVDSGDNDDEDDDTGLAALRAYNQRGQFQAIDSHSEEDDDAIEEEDEEDSDSENEELWRNHAGQVVNTSSEDDEDDDGDDGSVSSSSDDENVDFVKLSAERKARSLQQFRSASPFTKTSPKKAPAKSTTALKKQQSISGKTKAAYSTKIQSDSDLSDVEAPLIVKSPQKKKAQKTQPSKNENELQFTFEFNNNDNEIKLGEFPTKRREEEEDVGEELVEMIPDFAIDDIMPPRRQSIAPLTGFVNIQDSSDDSDSEINRDELLKTLEQESDGIEAPGFDTAGDDDDFDLLKEEADNILQELGNGEDHFQFGSQNTHRNPAVDEALQKHKDEVNPEEVLQFISEDDYDEYDYEDDDEEDYDQDQFQVPFFDDTMFLKNDQHKYTTTPNDEKENDSDDDSYLWDYFFSSGDERIRDNSRNNNGADSDDEEVHYTDDEETDEDMSLPPPSTRSTIASSTKAQELLSSSSVTARPPALGTWSTDSKPFGIIDGLSTRSLIPASASRKNSDFNPQSSTGFVNSDAIGNSLSNSPLGTTGASIEEEMNIDDLLNISEFDDNSDEDSQSLWDQTNRKVPLSAFRNKGVVNPDHSQNVMNATRRYSTTSSNGNGITNNGNINGIGHRRPSGSTNQMIGKLSSAKKNKKKKSQHIKSSNGNSQLLKRSNSISKSNISRQTSLRKRNSIMDADSEGLVLTKSGLFHEDTLLNVEELLSGLGNEAELSILFQ